MEGNVSPSLHLFWGPLKMLHRELVVIRTHDSLITPLRSSRKTRTGRSRGRVDPLKIVQIDRRYRCRMDSMALSLRRKLEPINSWMCIVFRVVSSFCLLKWLFITVWSRNEQPYVKEGRACLQVFRSSQSH